MTGRFFVVFRNAVENISLAIINVQLLSCTRIARTSGTRACGLPIVFVQSFPASREHRRENGKTCRTDTIPLIPSYEKRPPAMNVFSFRHTTIAFDKKQTNNTDFVIRDGPRRRYKKKNNFECDNRARTYISIHFYIYIYIYTNTTKCVWGTSAKNHTCANVNTQMSCYIMQFKNTVAIYLFIFVFLFSHTLISHMYTRYRCRTQYTYMNSSIQLRGEKPSEEGTRVRRDFDGSRTVFADRGSEVVRIGFVSFHRFSSNTRRNEFEMYPT